VSEPGGLVEIDLSSISKEKELNKEMNNYGKTETNPIKTSPLETYLSAEGNNVKNKGAGECNINFGYDAAGDEQNVTMGGAAVRKCEKGTNDSINEKQNGEKGHEKHAKDSEIDGNAIKEDNST
jgi:hypothetical protein